MRRHGGNVNAYYQVKEPYLKKIYTISFQLYDILENTKQQRQQKTNVQQPKNKNSNLKMDNEFDAFPKKVYKWLEST